jgi:hypothetical protein
MTLLSSKGMAVDASECWVREVGEAFVVRATF